MQEKTNLINDGGTMEKKFELLTFDELLKLPIDIESCFDPVFDPPIYLLDEWRKMREKENPLHFEQIRSSVTPSFVFDRVSSSSSDAVS